MPTLKQLSVFLILTSLLLAVPASALAHGGGTPQLVKTPAGPYEMYVWTNPDPVRVGTLHVSVALVQPETEEPVLNAVVDVTASPDSATSDPVISPATHENATVKSYYEADLELTEMGASTIAVAYRDGEATGSASFAVQVEAAGPNWQRIVMGVVLLAIGFAVLWASRRNRRVAAQPVEQPTEKS